MVITIDLLANHPEALPVVSQWAYVERGHQRAGHSLEYIERIYKGRINKNHPPITIVALEESRAIGAASLRIRELEALPDYEFWLGSVFVAEDHRVKGIGSMMVERIEELGREMGMDEIYLHTRRNEKWYNGQGWKVVKHISNEEHKFVIMRKVLVA